VFDVRGSRDARWTIGSNVNFSILDYGSESRFRGSTMLWWLFRNVNMVAQW